MQFSNVTLRYREDQVPALSDVTLELRPGETVALVGPSGAGKSTLVNLLPRFIEPTSGELRLDGQPVAAWDIAALRRQFALVSQDVVLFNDTLAENVALGGEIDRERVREALRGAHLLDFVATLPKGMDTEIGHNGSELSGGQRQRLAIARALANQPTLLLADEPTGALDSAGGEEILELFRRLHGAGQAIMLVTHDQSVADAAGRLVRMRDGRIENGTP
jgi:subfamily B ATP-binding cassette protein MsbA